MKQSAAWKPDAASQPKGWGATRPHRRRARAHRDAAQSPPWGALAQSCAHVGGHTAFLLADPAVGPPVRLGPSEPQGGT